MVRKGRLRDFEFLQQLAGAFFAVRQHLDNLQPVHISKGPANKGNIRRFHKSAPKICEI